MSFQRKFIITPAILNLVAEIGEIVGGTTSRSSFSRWCWA
jgi:hypothetical protein